MSEDAIDKMIEEIDKQQLKEDALKNLSINIIDATDPTPDTISGYIKLSFSTDDGFCFCSKWERFKIWFKTLFRRNKKQCCYGGGLTSYYDVSDLATSGLPQETSWFEKIYINGD